MVNGDTNGSDYGTDKLDSGVAGNGHSEERNVDSHSESGSFEDTASEIGDRVADGLGKAIATVPRLIPKQSRLFRKMALSSLRNYHKRSGGDALGIEARPGQQIDLVPVKYKPPEETGEEERGGWHIKNRDRTYDPGPDGQNVSFIDGKVPTVLLHSDASAETGWLAPRIGQAIEVDNYSPLFVGPTLAKQGTPQATAAAANGAMADGGHSVPVQTPSIDGFDMIDPGEFSGDNIVDLSSGDGHDGMRISLKKAKEWLAEESNSEKMQMQEERGYQAALANQDNKKDAVKIFLYAALLVLGVLAIVLLGPELVGGGGDGGGINPLISTLSVLGPV